MLRSMNRGLYKVCLVIRHPGMISAWWHGRGIRTLDAVCIECAGPAVGASPPLMTRAVFRLAAGRTFPYARAVVFAGRSDPLIHGELREMVLAARSYGREARVVTNGILLDEGTICTLIGAGTDCLAVSTASAGSVEYARVARNIELFGKIKTKLGVSRPVLELAPPGASAVPARCIDVAWDGTVYPGGALCGVEIPEPIGDIGELSPRVITRCLREL